MFVWYACYTVCYVHTSHDEGLSCACIKFNSLYCKVYGTNTWGSAYKAYIHVFTCSTPVRYAHEYGNARLYRQFKKKKKT